MSRKKGIATACEAKDKIQERRLDLGDFFGNNGNDLALGGAADNMLFGGEGADRLAGEGGDDIVVADQADLAGGSFSGGEGFDTLVWSSPEALALNASVRSFEMVTAGEGDDRLYVSAGTSADMLFVGGGG
ncbi:MAG TPA: hypothetical protein VGW34_11845, partial [Allosphingosinicella sp.]|nr:hypothetical protein [Allosphingosinicella sp.]